MFLSLPSLQRARNWNSVWSTHKRWLWGNGVWLFALLSCAILKSEPYFFLPVWWQKCFQMETPRQSWHTFFFKPDYTNSLKTQRKEEIVWTQDDTFYMSITSSGISKYKCFPLEGRWRETLYERVLSVIRFACGRKQDNLNFKLKDITLNYYLEKY